MHTVSAYVTRCTYKSRGKSPTKKHLWSKPPQPLAVLQENEISPHANQNYWPWFRKFPCLLLNRSWSFIREIRSLPSKVIYSCTIQLIDIISGILQISNTNGFPFIGKILRFSRSSCERSASWKSKRGINCRWMLHAFQVLYSSAKRRSC